MPFIMGAVAHIDDYKEGRYFEKTSRGDLSWNGYETNVLLRNTGSDDGGLPRFTDIGYVSGAGDLRDSRGMAVLDYDHDGDLDIAVNHNPGDLYQQEGIAPGLYQNRVGQRRNWFAVTLEGVTSNRDAVGALVTAVTGNHSQTRLLSAGSGYASQQSQRLLFGLADRRQIDKLVVRWPSGLKQIFENLPANRHVHLVEGASKVVRSSGGAQDRKVGSGPR